MAELTQTGLIFSPEGDLRVHIHREDGLGFLPFLPPQGWALVIVPKDAYDLCATETDILRLAMPELSVAWPDIAVLVEQKIAAVDASRIDTQDSSNP